MREVRYGVRSLRNSPGFAALAVITLALGIGANAAIFSVVKAVLLSSLPYKDAARLVYLRETKGGQDYGSISGPDLKDWKAQSHSFEEMTAYSPAGVTLTGIGEPTRLRGAQVTQGFFELFEAPPEIGRLFGASDYRPGSAVAVLSYPLWRDRFGADPGIAGRSIALSGKSYTVVGVAAPGFGFPTDTQIWTAYALGDEFGQNRGTHFLWGAARLKPGATLAAAQSEMDTISARLREQYPAENADRGVALVPFREQAVRFVRPMLLVLFATVGLVLLIACANVANLSLARAIARRPEMATRVALGARPRQLARQLLTESTLVAVAGGSLGIALGWATTRGILRLLPPGRLPSFAHVQLDWSVVGYSLGISLLSGLALGLAPVAAVLRSNLHDVMKLGSRRTGSSQATALYRSVLVVGQLALAMVLLVGGALMARSLARLLNVELGFQPESVTAFRIPSQPGGASPASPNAGPSAALRRADDLLERLRAMPGTRSAAYSLFLPLDGNNVNGEFAIEGEPQRPPGQMPVGEIRIVSPGYFPTLGIRLLRGRDFSEADGPNSPAVCVVNRSLAEKLFSGRDAIHRDPIGRRVALGDSNNRLAWMQIVGVVDDVKDFGLANSARLEIYSPFKQLPPEVWQFMGGTLAYVVKSGLGAAELRPAIARELKAVDANAPIFDFGTLQEAVSTSVAQPRFESWLLGAFSALGLAIAVAGIYSVLSWSVAQRTSEIGIRMALGAQARHVIAMVMARALVLVGLAIAFGLVGALALSRGMRSLLFGVGQFDPLLFAGVAALLAAVAMLASYLPARRAASVDPMMALRAE